MKIENTEVYGLERAIKISGYPKGNNNYSVDRASRLGGCASGTGHDCFLKGITVVADITAPQYWWIQFGRYHFWHGRDVQGDIISGESTMHGILKMDLVAHCNKYVDREIINHVAELVEDYNTLTLTDGERKHLFQRIISNYPMGLELKMGVIFNYLQIKSMYRQRKSHKLEEWGIFCKWAEGLPMFTKLVGAE